MKDIEKGQNLEITVNELVEEYSWLIAESSVQSIKKHGKMQTKTKTSVKAQLKEKFDSVEYVAGAGRRKAKFTLNNYNGNKEVYERENKGGRPSLDWTNELLVIRELINQEVAQNQEQLYKGFTTNQLLNKLLDFNKYKIEDIAKDEVENNRIFTLAGKQKDDEFGLRDTINNIVRNQRHIYVAKIEKELSKTNHRISYLDSNREEIDAEKYEEYMIFKKEVETKIKAENNRLKELKNEYFKAWLNTKDFDIKNEVQLLKEVDNAVQEKFGFKYAYRLFTVFNEIKVEGKGDINLVRENYFNRIMKNASSSQKNHQQTEEINYSEKPFYRLVHAGLYVEVMEAIFSKLVNFESKNESNIVDVLDNSVAEDDEAYQEF
ncbi:hypothetical protein [Lactococcus cremoris]|uniref:hypothetical protein n=3 Tax=Bacillota TaxID=1239 RepID=UPI0037C193CC